LEPGDLVVLYTDGVTESMDQDRETFGTERLKEVLAAAPQSAAAAGEAILGAVREHAVGRSQSDDITIVCFERSPE
jgi:sigma-B regulation protein RsbU (phosphoserine phosphatase)